MNFSLDGGAFFQPVDFQVNPSSGYRDTLGVRVVVESGKAHFAWVDFRNDSHMTGDIYRSLDMPLAYRREKTSHGGKNN